jgi:hypothetical protein
MENDNTWKLMFILLLIITGCKNEIVNEVNVYSVGDEIVYDTLGATTNETISLINTFNSLMNKGESKYKQFSWKKRRSYGDSLTYYEVILRKGQDKYDFNIYRLNNRILLFRNLESTDYRLLKNIKCIGSNCLEIDFGNVLDKIDSIIIPPMPIVDELELLETDSISIDF